MFESPLQIMLVNRLSVWGKGAKNCEETAREKIEKGKWGNPRFARQFFPLEPGPGLSPI